MRAFFLSNHQKTKYCFIFPIACFPVQWAEHPRQLLKKGRRALNSSVEKKVAVISGATPGKLERLGERVIEKGVKMW